MKYRRRRYTHPLKNLNNPFVKDGKSGSQKSFFFNLIKISYKVSVGISHDAKAAINAPALVPENAQGLILCFLRALRKPACAKKPKKLDEKTIPIFLFFSLWIDSVSPCYVGHNHYLYRRHIRLIL